jgi:hypothetical protein
VAALADKRRPRDVQHGRRAPSSNGQTTTRASPTTSVTLDAERSSRSMRAARSEARSRPTQTRATSRSTSASSESPETPSAGAASASTSNGRKADDIPTESFPRVDLSAKQTFLLGENRSASHDGRDFGPVPRDAIFARAVLIVWPLGRFGVPALRQVAGAAWATLPLSSAKMRRLRVGACGMTSWSAATLISSE